MYDLSEMVFQVFQTTRQTLHREANSFLARLSKEDDELPSEKVRFHAL